MVSPFTSYSQGFLPKPENLAAVFGSEIWAVTEMDMKRLGGRGREMHGPVVEQGIWRINTDQELRELYKNLDITADIRKNRLEWVGQVVRMDQVRRVKKIFESEPEGSRRRRRPGW